MSERQLFKVMTDIDIAFIIDKMYRTALQNRPFRVIIEPLSVAPPSDTSCESCDFWHTGLKECGHVPLPPRVCEYYLKSDRAEKIVDKLQASVPICPKCGKEAQCFWCQASVDDADKYYMGASLPRAKDTVRFDTPSGVPLDVELPDVAEPVAPCSPLDSADLEEALASLRCCEEEYNSDHSILINKLNKILKLKNGPGDSNGGAEN